MRILALTWPTFDNEKDLMINQRGDLLCPAIDGLTNELLKLGHQVVYVNLMAEERELSEKEWACLGFISGLPFHKWDDIRNRDFDIVWSAIKDPTPPQCLPHYVRIIEQLSGIPIINDARKLADHTKTKYIKVLREKNVGAIILDNYEFDYHNCHPPSNGCYVSKDLYAIRLSNKNSQRTTLVQDGITLRYQNTAKFVGAKPGLRSFFRVPYAAGQCLEGTMYYCPEDILCPKSGAAVERVPYSIPQMTAGTVSAGMKELGVDIAHIEGVVAGFTVEIFDVNPFPSSAGATLQPMAEKMAKRIEMVYDL